MYERQKTLFQPSDPTVFYASLFVRQHNESGEVTSIATWSDGVESLLPKSDRIGFVRGKGDIATVTWDEAERVLGPLVEEPGPWPPRYRVSSFPTEEQYATLKALSTI